MSMMTVWCGRLARTVFRKQRPNHPEINSPNILSAGAKRAPSRQRISKASQIKRASEIVSTATRHNQDGKLQLDQSRQVTMHCPVSTEDENRVGLIRVCRKVSSPVRF
jgi:hypothetical protein